MGKRRALMALMSLFVLPAFAGTEAIAKRVGLPAGLGAALVKAESSGDPRAESQDQQGRTVSRGLTQINRKYEAWLVSRYFGGKPEAFDVWNPEQNAEVGFGYLYDLKRRFGTWEWALAAYNWGPTMVASVHGDWDRVPPGVRRYVNRVMVNWEGGDNA
jgi:soluble lytic murein transglycosylase-like protein